MAEATILLVVRHTGIIQVNKTSRISIGIDGLQVVSTVDKRDTSHTSAQRRIEKGIQIPREMRDPATKTGEEIL